jgi:hypothetical protein
MMKVQYLTNDKGERISVLIPFNEWNRLNQEREELRSKLQEAELAQRYREALTDIQLFKEGKLKTRPIQELLDEL